MMLYHTGMVHFIAHFLTLKNKTALNKTLHFRDRTGTFLQAYK